MSEFDKIVAAQSMEPRLYYLLYMDGLASKAISDLLDVPEEEIEKSIAETKRNMKKMLARQFIDKQEIS